MTCDIPIILLAAGSSSRMRGRDKLMEDIDGQPLITRQAKRARAATSGPVIVALPPAPHPRYDALDGIEATLLPVADTAEGMGASLRAAVAAVPPDARAVMVVLADLPELTTNDLKRVLDAVDEAPGKLVWRGATDDGRPGHPIVFSAPLFPRLARLCGDTGGRDVVAAVGNKLCLVPLPGRHALADLDTPEDWDVWRAGRNRRD